MSTLPETMTAITITAPGGPDVLQPATVAVPKPGTGQLLMKVMAAGVNRPDVLQREGKYPVPPGASPLPGLEAAGEVVALGSMSPFYAGLCLIHAPIDITTTDNKSYLYA